MQNIHFRVLATIFLLLESLQAQGERKFHIGMAVMPQSTSFNSEVSTSYPSGSYIASYPKGWNLGMSFGVMSRYFFNRKGLALSVDLMYSTQVQEGEFDYYYSTSSSTLRASSGNYRMVLRLVKLPIQFTSLLGKGPVYFTGLVGFQPQIIVGSREVYKVYNFYAYPPYEETDRVNGYIYDICGNKFNLALSAGLGVDIWPKDNLGIALQLRTDMSLIDPETYGPLFGKIKGYDTLGFLLGIYY